VQARQTCAAERGSLSRALIAEVAYTKTAAFLEPLGHARVKPLIKAFQGRGHVPNTNPGRELTCPRCPKRLRYVTTRSEDGHVHQKTDRFETVANVHVYECASHGRFHVGPNGRVNVGG
jgi:hypothetical protein